MMTRDPVLSALDRGGYPAWVGRGRGGEALPCSLCRLKY